MELVQIYKKINTMSGIFNTMSGILQSKYKLNVFKCLVISLYISFSFLDNFCGVISFKHMTS